MNISHLMRGLIGNQRMSEANVLELKVGEVVKGTVIKVLSPEQALININGTVINAKLETPLNPGQVTMLQVQPDSSQGLIVLKPLGSSQVQISNASLVELLKSFGLKNQSAERLLIQHMHMEGLALNKDNVSRLAAILNHIPDRIPTTQWIQSGILAMQRGLPITVQTVTALHQVLFGQSIDQVVRNLHDQVNQQLQAQPSVKGAPSPLQQLFVQLELGLQQLQATGQMGIASSSGYVSNPVNSEPLPNPIGHAASTAAPALGQAIAHDGSQTAITNSTAGTLVNQGAPAAMQVSAEVQSQTVVSTAMPTVQTQLDGNQAIAPLHQSETSETANVVPHTSFPISGHVTTQQQTPVANDPAVLTGMSEQNVRQATTANNVVNSEQNQLAAGVTVASTLASEAAIPLAQAANGNTWISSMLKLLGIEHEQQTSRLAGKPELANMRQHADPSMILSQDRQSGELQRPAQVTPWDNIKSLLMQMTSSGELSPTMRESAQQLLQHITGQQLFMTADRASHFTHMTLFIPLHDENGTQTAAINIQSRKGKQGEIDPENCRMVFDLNMANLGNTLIDVVVTNKIVSLQVHNDHPLIGQIMDEGRSVITDALLQVGYQLSSMTTTPLPEIEKNETASSANEIVKSALTSLYSAKPYKGLDVRI